MRRWRPPPLQLAKVELPRFKPARGGAWTRTAKHHKQVHLQCAHCGAVDGLETDHIKPKHLGGTDDWSNLQSLCKACHAVKTRSECG